MKEAWTRIARTRRFLILVPLAAMLLNCDRDKPTVPEKEEARILAVSPSELEAGSRTRVSIVGENTGFGDSLWLEKDDTRITGVIDGAESDTALVAEFDIPETASLGTWDVVVAGKGESPETRLVDGITVIPAMVRIESVSPSKLSALGPQSLKITFSGRILKQSLPQVRFSKGQDTLPIGTVFILDETAVSVDVIVMDTMPHGSWNLDVTLPTRKLNYPDAVELAPIPVSMTVSAPDSVEQDTYIRLDVKGMNTFFTNDGLKGWLRKGTDSIPSISNPDFAFEYFFGIYFRPQFPGTDTSLTLMFHIPAESELGDWNLHVRHPWYSLSEPAVIRVFPPTPMAVKAITPVSAHRGEHVSVAITGHRTRFGMGTLTHVRMNLVQGTDNLAFSSLFKRTGAFIADVGGQIPKHAPLGAYDVYASYNSPQGSATTVVSVSPLRNGFTVLEYNEDWPDITAIEPAILESGSRTLVELTGRNLTGIDQVWIQYTFPNGNVRKVEGVKSGSATAALMELEFDIPSDSPTGPWNLAFSQLDGRPAQVEDDVVSIVAAPPSNSSGSPSP